MFNRIAEGMMWRTLLLWGTGLVLSGCATVHLSMGGVDKLTAMSGDPGRRYTVVRHFTRDAKAVFTLFGLVTVVNPDLAEVVREEIVAARGDAVVGIRIKGQKTLVDGLVPIALGTLGGLLLPPFGSVLSYVLELRTYTIEGEIIRYMD
jgi:hypothetical protein